MGKAYHFWTLALVGLWVWFLGPGALDGTLRPVVSDVHMAALQDPADPEWVYVSGGFYKNRDACEPIQIRWRLGERSDMSAPVEFRWGAPVVRRVGLQTFYNWHVRAAPPKTLENLTYADVVHQCFIRIAGQRFNYPWQTISPFWN